MSVPIATFARGGGDYEWSGEPVPELLRARLPALVGAAAARGVEGVLVMRVGADVWLASRIARDGKDDLGRPKAGAAVQRFEDASAYNAFEIALGVRNGVLRKTPEPPLSRPVRARLALGRTVSLTVAEASAGAASGARYPAFFCATSAGWSLEPALSGLLLCGVSVPPDPFSEVIERLDDVLVDELASHSTAEVDAVLGWLAGQARVPDLKLARSLILSRRAPPLDEREGARVLAHVLANGELSGRTEDAERLFDACAPALVGARDALVAWIAHEDLQVPPPLHALSITAWRELLVAIDPVAVLEHLLTVSSEPSPLSTSLVDAIRTRRLGPRVLLPRRIRARHPTVCAELAALPGWEAWSPDEEARRALVSAWADQLGLQILFVEPEVIDVE